MMFSYIYSIIEQKIFKLVMTHNATYEEFLTQIYKKIIEACLEDEAVQTLKILENKDYLLQRVNELFAQIYHQERQNKIVELINYTKELQSKGQPNKVAFVSQECQSCEVLKKQLYSLEKEKRNLMKQIAQINEFEEKESNKLDLLMIQETQSLRKQLKNAEESLHLKVNEWNSEKQQLIRLNQTLRQHMKAQNHESQTTVQQLSLNLQNTLEQKYKLEKQLYNYLEQKGQEQKDLREANNKAANINIIKEKLTTELELMKKQKVILEEKSKRLEEENISLKECVSTYEKQNKILKKKNFQMLEQFHTEKISFENRMQQKQNDLPNDLMSKYSQLQKVNIQIDKMNTDLKQEISTKTNQFSFQTLTQEKKIIELTQELKQLQINHEKDIRILKEENKTVSQRNYQRYQDLKEKQIAQITKRFQTIVNEKTRSIEKLTQKNKELNKNILKAQEMLSDTSLEYQEEKKQMMKLLQKEKTYNREMKKHYQQGKISEQLSEKQYSQIIHSSEKEKQELNIIIDNKNKDIKKLNKELSSLTDQISNKDFIISSLQLKVDEATKNIDSFEFSSKQNKQNIKQKERIIKQLTKKHEIFVEEKEQLENKLNRLLKNDKGKDEKIKKLEEQLKEKKKLVLTLQEENKKQVLDLYQKTQNTSTQSKRQLESYYITLLKNQEEKLTYEQKKAIEKAKELQVNELQSKSEELQQKMMRYKSKYSEESKERQSLEDKITHLLAEIDKNKQQNLNLVEQLRQEKKNNLQIIRSYQEQMIQYYNQFGQFKKELFFSIKEELLKLKNQLQQIESIVEKQIKNKKEVFSVFSSKIIQEVDKVSIQNQIKIERVRHSYEHGAVLRLEQEKKEVKVQMQLKLKEQSMEFYTILAEKQHLINIFENKEEKLMYRINDLEAKNDQIQKIARQSTKKQEELKQIINKMNVKVNEAERYANTSKNEIEYLKKQNMQLKKEMMNIENSFKQKIQKCREGYAAENQRLFTKYEKQFSKFIVSNRKGLQFSMISPNKSSNMLIPTKGCHNDDKLDKIQRQIEVQKKKLNILQHGYDEKNKMDKTKKIPNDFKMLNKSKKL